MDIEVRQDQDKQVYEDRIKWLKHDLYHSELEVARLYKERWRGPRIRNLRPQISVICVATAL